MTMDPVFYRWTVLTAIAVAQSACGIEHAVVAALGSGGAAGAENGGSAGETLPSAGQVSTFTDPQMVEDTPAAPLAGAGGSGGSGVSAATSSSGGTSGSGGASGSERPFGGVGGVDERTVAGTTNDCLNVTEPAGSSGGGAGDIDSDASMACACLGQAPIRLCGMDGVTYEAPCEGDCPAVEIACLQECPCDDMEAAQSTMMFWFTPNSAARDECTEGFACIGFSPETGALQSSCITLSMGE